MKCLEKDRRRRYDTAEQLAADIGVASTNPSPRPPSLGYHGHEDRARTTGARQHGGRRSGCAPLRPGEDISSSGRYRNPQALEHGLTGEKPVHSREVAEKH
ncbi:MAG: hypothetical protein U1G08_21045 [Verrucomicrobiota bacterium]